ncbi:MAG: diaminopimelate epimerase [Ignavibacteriae bacterium]|nr:diaminopimelate epimerase [Ignavibacteriota bacterium]
MSGAGNDFVVIDNRTRAITDGAALARKLCDRRWGIGADGLLLIEPSQQADYRMMYYNSDGSYGGMCGNGGRCIAFFTASAGIAKQSHTFEALDFVYHADISNGSVTLRMKDPVGLKLDIMLPVLRKKIKLHFIDTGSPHVVIPVQSLSRTKGFLEKAEIDSLGREIRNHKRFQPAGANVNFIEKVGAKSIKMRTYERGVEAETLACGTGSVACAIIASVLWDIMPPVQVITRSNQTLVVNFAGSTDSFHSVTLKGPAQITFKGEVEV